jgi:ribosome biogenesis GTPase
LHCLEFVATIYGMDMRSGIVIRGINNIYSIVDVTEINDLASATVFECRIKGKILSDVEDEYSPLAVGDQVDFHLTGDDEGLIIRRSERKNSFDRWNQKRGRNQTLVANMDLIVCISSTDMPPFRPRFIDRAIVCANGIPLLIVLNKADLPLTEEQDQRFRLYAELGYETFVLSAFDQEGITALKKILQGKTVALIGQSGVGKSTITNALLGDMELQKVGSVSQKYQRGRHTTNHAIMLAGQGFTIVDTPGMRELLVPHTSAYQIAQNFPEFRKVQDQCAFVQCTHIHEPDCAVKALVENQEIHPDRYASYERMIQSLSWRPQEWELGL